MAQSRIPRSLLLGVFMLACGDDSTGGMVSDASTDRPSDGAMRDASSRDAPTIDAPQLDAPADALAIDAESLDAPQSDAEVSDAGLSRGFGSPLTFSVGTSAYLVAVGDFNEDGKLDVATTSGGNATPVNLITLLGNGDGTLASPSSHFLGQQPLLSARDIVVADFNRDGHLDIAVGLAYGPTKAPPSGWISVFLGDGAGGFTFSASYDGDPGVYDIAVADVNGDGFLDLVSANSDGSASGASLVGTLLGNGDGTFGLPRLQSIGPGTAFGIAVGQFTNDGIPDVVVCNGLGQGVTFMRGVGDGSFQFVSNTPVGAGQFTNSWSIVARDFDGDGALDLAVGSSSGTPGVLSVLRGNLSAGSPDGTFGTPTTYTIGGSLAQVAVADFNGDGKADLAFSRGQSTISVVLGDGRAGFALDRNYQSGNYSDGIAAGDFNGDGKPDLVVANSLGTISVLLNQYP